MKIEQKAILFTVFSVCLFSLLNCITKLLAHNFNVYVLLTYRSFISLIMATLCLILTQKKIRAKFTLGNFLRGAVDFASIPLWMLALHHMQVTQVISVAFLTPVVCAIIAAFILKDKMPLNKWIACFVAMLGVWIVVKPDIYGFNYYTFAVLAVCVLWAISAILLKKLSIGNQTPLVIIFYTNVVIFILTIPFAIDKIKVPSTHELLLLLLMGLIAFLGNFAMAISYSLTRITNLLPFEYLKLMFTAIIAFFMFGEIIKINTIIGSTIILLSTVYVAKTARK